MQAFRRAGLAAFALLALAPASHAQADRTYQNPLPVRLASGAPAQNCADPAVLRDPRSAQPSWYLFCTSDPVSKDERAQSDEQGGWHFRMMPIYRSDDLVHWDFVADAFSARPPGLADSDSGLWAPEPAYLNGRYYLYFTVTNVADAHSPEPACASDSGIGVAVADSPAGPWRAREVPVVAPRRAGPGCNFRWTYDPKVVSEGGRHWLYYGSYGGGIWVQSLREDGMAVEGQPVKVGADERYEGAEVIRRDGWWYLFASATNCCNGPLTGYAVFVGRARTPAGPFLDRLGQDMALGRAGGTPLLMQNGNRWVGVGHNTVFTDAAGQWWTIYHGVDLGEPFFSARDKLTRRLALLDRIDWIDGWPVAGGGQAPSDAPLPAPAVLADAPPLPPPQQQAAPERVRPMWSDTLRGPRLERRWSWLRPRGGWTLGRAGLRLPSDPSELYADTNGATVLQTALPASGDYRVEAVIALDAPEECCDTPVQAGLVLMRDDDNYVKLVELANKGLRQVEFGKEAWPVAPDWPRYGNTLAGTPARTTWLRIDVHRMGEEERYTAYSSADGKAWVGGAAWTHRLGVQARLGLVAMGGAGRMATFSRVAVSRLSR